MKNIVVRSPLRVDLAGGTLDLWPLYNFVGGAHTVNVAIDLFTTVELQELPGAAIELISEDLHLHRHYSSLEQCLQDPDRKLHLLQVQLAFWRPQKGFRLRTQSDSPVGGGLGGSSSLTISMLKAFDQFTRQDGPAAGSRFSSVHDLVQVAHNLEAQVLNTPTGTQDYYPAASGGINILQYSVSGIEQTVLPILGTLMADHFLLVYTGKAHHSGINNFEVLTKAVHRDPQVTAALHDLKDLAAQTAKLCQTENYEPLASIFRAEFAARVRLAKAFSSPEIESLSQLCLQAGALAVKICGAGGGGCVLVWVQPSCRQEVIKACQKSGFKVLPAAPWEMQA